MPPRNYISGKPKLLPPRAPSNKPSSSNSNPKSSTIPTGLTAGGIGIDDDRITEFSSPMDVCPVCRNDRYLQPKLRLRVSSLCYHVMCESCLDRIFSLGPEKCPQCEVTLRKAQFKTIVFEDLGVQKELAIRKRTAKIFNKRQEDFGDDLKAYNNYLEEFEDLTFNLINSLDVEATEARIRTYEADNRLLIEANLSLEEVEAQSVKLRDEETRKVREEMKSEFMRMDEEDRLAKERERKAVLEGLSSSTSSTSQILSLARASALKRSSLRSTLASTIPLSSDRLLSLRLQQTNSLANSQSALDEMEEFLNIDKELGKWDGGEMLYDMRLVRGEGEGGGTEGGFRVEEVWEKGVREAVGGLWLSPRVGR